MNKSLPFLIKYSSSNTFTIICKSPGSPSNTSSPLSNISILWLFGTPFGIVTLIFSDTLFTLYCLP